MCKTTQTERLAVVTPFLDAAAAKEEQRALELVQSVEAILSRYRAHPKVPLDLIDRCERALVQTHAHNLLRLPTFSQLDEPS